MSEENKQPQDTRKDLDILNKMKNLPGGRECKIFCVNLLD